MEGMVNQQTGREIFTHFLRQLVGEQTEALLPQYDRLLQALLEVNATVNLISRRTPPDDYWTLHLLDSLLPAPLFPLDGQNVLDFGTGGGLPGLPLKLLYPSCSLTLLDSCGKKVEAVKKLVKILDLKRCDAVYSRVEELSKRSRRQRFDTVLCRSVRITPETAGALPRLLNPGGRLLLYKGRSYEDTALFPVKRVIDISHPAVGVRHLIVVEKQA